MCLLLAPPPAAGVDLINRLFSSFSVDETLALRVLLVVDVDLGVDKQSLIGTFA